MRRLLSFAVLTASYKVGQLLKRRVLGSRFVKNDVATFAPFSYVIDTPTGRAVHDDEDDEKSVNDGANKKNLMPFFV